MLPILATPLPKTLITKREIEYIKRARSKEHGKIIFKEHFQKTIF